MPTFRSWLASADVAVQLRALSRGETSAAVLDCMAYGLPTIVNANGSFSGLPPDAVCMLPDEFSDDQLIEALETLWREVPRRTALGLRAREEIAVRHAPDACALQYFNAIESYYAVAGSGITGLINAISVLESRAGSDRELASVAGAIARSIPGKQAARNLYLDVSATCRTDLKTGIERVARALTVALLEKPPEGLRIEPVYLSDQGGVWHYRHARRYTLGVLDCRLEGLNDDPVQPGPGDIIVGLDLSGEMLVQAHRAGLFRSLRADGVVVRFMVFDLLPLTLPHTFPPGADEAHRRWLAAVADMDGAICISKAVADDLDRWVQLNIPGKTGRFCIDWVHLGADIENSAPSGGIPPESGEVLEQCASRVTFLMVGTVEPRKGYQLVVDAFSRLWHEGADINLVIVGREGWRDLPDDLRRTIPDIASGLRNHPERGRRLFWLEGISDEYLEKLYAASNCLIAASEGEGFGLPLIEAAQHKLPVIARDIQVFREVAGAHAFYFDSDRAGDLARSLTAWLRMYAEDEHPLPDDMPWQTWRECAGQLLAAIVPRCAADMTVSPPGHKDTEQRQSCGTSPGVA